MKLRSQRPRVIALACALIGSIVIAPAAGAEPAAAGGDRSVFVVRAGAESDLAALTRAASSDSDYGRQAQGLLDAWSRTTAAGKPLTGVVGLEHLSAQQQLTEVQGAHAKVASIRAESQHTADVGASAVAVAAIDGHDPNSFEVRGAPGSGRTYWANMYLAIAAHFCTPSSCSGDTDRVTTRLRIDPNGYRSTFSSTTVYAPNSGNFGNKHLHLWSITPGGHASGEGDTQEISTSHVDTLKNNPRTNGKYMTLAVALWVYLKPYASYTPDGAKTNDAKCNALPSNACRYP